MLLFNIHTFIFNTSSSSVKKKINIVNTQFSKMFIVYYLQL